MHILVYAFAWTPWFRVPGTISFGPGAIPACRLFLLLMFVSESTKSECCSCAQNEKWMEKSLAYCWMMDLPTTHVLDEKQKIDDNWNLGLSLPKEWQQMMRLSAPKLFYITTGVFLYTRASSDLLRFHMSSILHLRGEVRQVPQAYVSRDNGRNKRILTYRCRTNYFCWAPSFHCTQYFGL